MQLTGPSECWQAGAGPRPARERWGRRQKRERMPCGVFRGFQRGARDSNYDEWCPLIGRESDDLELLLQIKLDRIYTFYRKIGD